MKSFWCVLLVVGMFVGGCAVFGQSKNVHESFGCWPIKEAEQCRWLTSDCRTISAFTVHVKEEKWFVFAPLKADYIYCTDVVGKRVGSGECAGITPLPEQKGECFKSFN